MNSILRSNIQINDNGFIFCYDLGSTFTANATGVELLRMLQQGYTTDRMRLRMNEVFGISDTVFEKDFHDFTIQLKNLRLLV